MHTLSLEVYVSAEVALRDGTGRAGVMPVQFSQELLGELDTEERELLARAFYPNADSSKPGRLKHQLNAAPKALTMPSAAVTNATVLPVLREALRGLQASIDAALNAIGADPQAQLQRPAFGSGDVDLSGRLALRGHAQQLAEFWSGHPVLGALHVVAAHAERQARDAEVARAVADPATLVVVLGNEHISPRRWAVRHLPEWWSFYDVAAVKAQAAEIAAARNIEEALAETQRKEAQEAAEIAQKAQEAAEIAALRDYARGVPDIALAAEDNYPIVTVVLNYIAGLVAALAESAGGNEAQVIRQGSNEWEAFDVEVRSGPTNSAVLAQRELAESVKSLALPPSVKVVVEPVQRVTFTDQEDGTKSFCTMLMAQVVCPHGGTRAVLVSVED